VRQRSQPDLAVRVGVDLVAVEHMARVLTANPTACETLLTAGEQAACNGRRRRDEHVAARFAAKEAVLKAFGTGLAQRMRWTDVEVVRGRGGRPEIELHGEVAALARRRGLASLDISLTHTAGLALAHAVAVFDARGPACAST
jgi:holo-[acyl-carrier protein] synthase